MEAPVALGLMRALLPVPPFPGARPQEAFTIAPARRSADRDAAAAFIAAIRAKRIGGTSWGACPAMGGDRLRVQRGGQRPAQSNEQASVDFVWRSQDAFDPWWLFDHAALIIVIEDDAMALLAVIAGVSVQFDGPTALAELASLLPKSDPHQAWLVDHISKLLAQIDCHDPVTGRRVAPIELAERFGDWRALIDDNRPIVAAFGFARWKQATAAPMLWGGQPHQRLFKNARAKALATLPSGSAVAVWKARIDAAALARLETTPVPVYEVEDGFIRSVGLGANCVPPYSIIVDPQGVHYDPARPSALEAILAAGIDDPALLERARALQARIVVNGISKYGVGAGQVVRSGGQRCHVLVVGQVEDDRSVRFGSQTIRTNAALLAAVRAAKPEAWIVYRPHPDIEAGHRPGRIPTDELTRLADQVEADAPISALISAMDEVHVMTSLAGFEALLHGKAVTTWGAPFYAGWGLTTDHAPGWSCRRGSRTLDELIAATLFLYPRYVDPVSGLPCPVETLVDRLIAGELPEDGWLVRLRTWHGRGKRIMVRLLERFA
jgi:capsular polysaccharide export protein